MDIEFKMVSGNSVSNIKIYSYYYLLNKGQNLNVVDIYPSWLPVYLSKSLFLDICFNLMGYLEVFLEVYI